jgi:glycosyltransferase involved in cell wall biosynthesis
VTLDIYGPDAEGAYAEECRRQTAGMGNVHWKGSIAPGTVVPTLAHYDLLCLPSTFSEMSPLVIQEAFAAGIPVLASNVYGNAEQLSDGVNSWLFEFKNIASLKEKLQLLINDPVLLEQAKKRLPITRSFDAVASEHLALYKSVLEAKISTAAL